MRGALLACILALGACDEMVSDTIVRESAAPLTPASLPAFFDCLRENGGTIVSGHRGGRWADYAENAIDTFELTLSQSPAFLEVDIRRTREGALVLMHDDTVDRTTDGTGDVRNLTLAQFRSLRLQDSDGDTLDAHPPTLREALDWADGRAILELDVKRGVSYEDVVREVEEVGAMDRVVFITYSVAGAARLARIAPQAMLYTTIESRADIVALERTEIDLGRVVAWIGDDELNPDLIALLAERSIEARAGMFGGAGPYETVVGRGVQILAVDDAPAAVALFDAMDDSDGYAAMQCVGAR